MSDSGKFLVGLLTGIGIGAAIGVLIAPDKGSNTYKKLEGAVKDATKDLREYSEEKIKQAKEAKS
ncbi:MAG: YtxH domain-containing protein [Fulvivirga sp.]